jgi:glycosyltransferase involved in cell wall biosynthesis
MIRIGVDGRFLQGNLTGVGKYMLNLIDELCELDNAITFIIYTNKEVNCSFRGTSKVKVVYDSKWTAKIKPMVWSKLWSFNIINKDRIDVYLSGDGFVPLFLDKTKVVSVVHDLNSKIAPETMSRLRIVTDKLFFRTDIQKADVVISNSYGTANKLKYYFNIDTDVVVHPIIDSWYKKLDAIAVSMQLQKMGVNYPYLLTVATREPRKNLDKTINAFLSIKKKGLLPGHKLVLIGSKGWKSEAIDDLIANNSGMIVQLGYTADELMPYLYNGADAFLFPSLYEGFGMPVREALLCDVPVITSDLPELREASYDKAIYIDPNSNEAFITAILTGVDLKYENFLSSVKHATQDQLNQLLNLIKASNGL